MKLNDESRDIIIESAREVFGRWGYKKTSVKDVASLIGKGKSSIYYYFSSKDEIYKAVIEKEATLFKQEIIKAYSKQKTSIEKLKVYITTRMLKFMESANLYEAIKNEYLSHLSFIIDIRNKYDNDEIAIIQTILHEGVAKDEFIIDDPDLAAYAITIAMKGLEIPILIDEQEDISKTEKRINNLLNILFYGIVKR